MFRTEVKIPVGSHSIGLDDPIVSLGSCFSEMIGSRLLDSKFNVLNNPFGTIYHPVAITQLIEMALADGKPTTDSYLLNKEVWHNYYFHSRLSSVRKEELQKNIEEKLEALKDYLSKSKWLIITLGSAFGYERVGNGELVANCHKMPAKLFNKRLYVAEKIITKFNSTLEVLKRINPEIKILLTVSPVRHIKDSLTLNSVSKSILRLACHDLQEQYKDVYYFPSYEIMMDDLRDYRFYSDDLIHPNKQGEDYIWGKFSEGFFESKTLKTLKKWSALKRSLNHKPFNPNTQEHLKFLKNRLQDLKEFESELNVSTEIKEVSQRIDGIKSNNPG